jgi:hypothetical protein
LKTRVNLTLTETNLETIEQVAILTKTSKSKLIDELLTDSQPVFLSLIELLKKAKHLDQLARDTIKGETTQAEKQAQKLITQANRMMTDLDSKISAQIVQLNRKKTPASNTGVRK